MAKLSVQEVKNFKTMMHELKEAFVKKRAEAQGSRERMKTLADRFWKCLTGFPLLNLDVTFRVDDFSYKKLFHPS